VSGKTDGYLSVGLGFGFATQKREAAPCEGRGDTPSFGTDGHPHRHEPTTLGLGKCEATVKM